MSENVCMKAIVRVCENRSYLCVRARVCGNESKSSRLVLWQWYVWVCVGGCGGRDTLSPWLCWPVGTNTDAEKALANLLRPSDKDSYCLPDTVAVTGMKV